MDYREELIEKVAGVLKRMQDTGDYLVKRDATNTAKLAEKPNMAIGLGALAGAKAKVAGLKTQVRHGKIIDKALGE